MAHALVFLLFSFLWLWDCFFSFPYWIWSSLISFYQSHLARGEVILEDKKKSDYCDILWELQATWSAAVGQSCSASFLVSCFFCKRYTWELGLSTFISAMMASILGWQICTCHLMRDWDCMSRCRWSQEDSDLWPSCISPLLLSFS